MGKSYFCKSLRASAAALLLSLGAVQPLQAQAPAPAAPYVLLRTVAVPNPGPVSLDRRGTLYVADREHNLRQFGLSGQQLNIYSPLQAAHVGGLEAWNLNQVLLFFDDRQQVLLLDRFLAPLSEIRLADYFDGIVRSATLAPDGLLWLLDESALTLRELDTQTLRLVQNTPLDLLLRGARPDFRTLRFYQNNLYLVDRNGGILVFDNLGNYRKKLPFVGLDFIAFQGDELLYLSGGQLHFFHLYNFTERTEALPEGLDPAAVRQVLCGDTERYFVTSEGVRVYRR